MEGRSVGSPRNAGVAVCRVSATRTRRSSALPPHAPQTVPYGLQALGRERLTSFTIHHGRHTFISHALAGGRTLAEVRDAAGHANVIVTSGYLHVAVESEAVGRLFA